MYSSVTADVLLMAVPVPPRLRGWNRNFWQHLQTRCVQGNRTHVTSPLFYENVGAACCHPKDEAGKRLSSPVEAEFLNNAFVHGTFTNTDLTYFQNKDYGTDHMPPIVLIHVWVVLNHQMF